MRTQNSVTIAGELESVYDYASRVEKWPEILPHYRDVKILESGVKERLVSMHCVRSFGLFNWTCKWRAKQTLDPEASRIYFRHVSGPAKGMQVEWALSKKPDGVETTIRHDLHARSLVNKLYAAFIGPMFIEPIAGQTLARIKALVEGKVKP